MSAYKNQNNSNLPTQNKLLAPNHFTPENLAAHNVPEFGGNNQQIYHDSNSNRQSQQMKIPQNQTHKEPEQYQDQNQNNQQNLPNSQNSHPQNTFQNTMQNNQDKFTQNPSNTQHQNNPPNQIQRNQEMTQDQKQKSEPSQVHTKGYSFYENDQVQQDQSKQMKGQGEQKQSDSNQQGIEMNNVFNQPSESQKQTLKQLRVLSGQVFRVMKLSESSLSYNPRMMGVRPIGMLVYYSKIVDDVKTGKIDRILIPPKAGVLIKDVKQFKFDYNNKEKFQISLTFSKNKMYNFDRQGNEVLNYPSTQKEISWTFVIEGSLQIEEDDLKKQKDKQQKAELLKAEYKNKDEQQKQQFSKKQQAIMDRMQKKEEQNVKKSQEKPNEIPEREQLQIQQDLLIKQQNEDASIKAQELQRENENKQRIENDTRLKNDKKSIIESAWEYRMHLMIDDMSKIKGDDQNSLFLSGLKLFQLVGAFRESCVKTVKELIDDLAIQESHKKFTQIDTQDIRYGLKESGEMIYYLNKLIIRISNTELVKEQDYQNIQSKSSQREPHKDLNTTTYYDSRRSQLINHEFRSYEIMSDILMLNRENSFCQLQVPMTCSVEYRGYKCLCMADLPIEDNSLVVGAIQSGAYITHTPLIKDFITLSKLLNLKPYKLPVNRGQTDIYLSIFCEVYRAQPKMWDDTIKLIDENSQLWRETQSVLKKQKDKLDRLETGKDSDQDKDVHDKSKEQFYYLVKLGGIFPVQVDINKQSYNYYSNRLRPELVTEQSQVPLSSGAFLSPQTTNESNQDDIAVGLAGQKLLKDIIPQMVASLDRLSTVPVDSSTITRIFHQSGINMRFLGRLAKLSQLPHLKEIALIEIVARTLKKILNHHWVEFANIHFRDENSDLFDHKTSRRLTEQLENQKQVEGRIESSCGDVVIDFLNLIFGSSKDTAVFWDDIIRPQALTNYNQDIGKFPIEVTSGGLMHAILYHCRIKINYTNQIQFFLVKNPFQRQQFISLLPHSKVYTFRSQFIRVLADKYKEFRTNVNSLDLALKSLNLKVSIEKALRNEHNQPHAPLPEAIYFSDMGEIHLQRAAALNEDARTNTNAKEQQQIELDQAIAKAREALKMIPHLHAESVKPLCVLLKAYFCKPEQQVMALEYFDQAINILEFHVGPYHPLHASLYSIMSQCYLQKKKYQDCLVLLKSALICCTRILGNNHQMTAEVYMDMANVYMQMNDRIQAIKVMQKAMVIIEAEKGVESIDCGKLNLQLSDWFSEIGKYDSALEYAEVALKIFEPHDITYSQMMVEATYNCAKSCNSLGDHQGKVRFCEKLYTTLETYQIKNEIYYEFAIKSVMVTMFEDQVVELKSFLYKLMIALSTKPDELQRVPIQTNNLIHIKSRSLVEQKQQAQEQQPELEKIVGMADQQTYKFDPPIQLFDDKIKIIHKIIKQIRPAKNLQNFFKSMCYCFQGRLNEMMFYKDLYKNFDKFMDQIKDSVFSEYVEIYKDLLKLYGEDLFYQSLKMTHKFV